MKSYSFALLFLVGVFGILVCVVLGLYPAALVAPARQSGARPHIIGERSVRRIARATVIYYEYLWGRTALSTVSITPMVSREARGKAVEALINQVFVADAARQVATEAEIQMLVQEKLTRYSALPNFNTAVSLLYGLNDGEFIKFIARPETEKELLKKKKGWDDAALEQWLAEEKRRAQIVKFIK